MAAESLNCLQINGEMSVKRVTGQKRKTLELKDRLPKMNLASIITYMDNIL